MIRKSNYKKSEYYQKISESIQLYQDSTANFDAAAAESLGLNQTDLACLGVIFKKGTVSASEVAKATGLTKGAMTTALDRIEKKGFAKRVENENDRRGVNLELTKKGRDSVWALWGHFATEGLKILEQFDTHQLDAILTFLEEARDMQDRHREKIGSR